MTHASSQLVRTGIKPSTKPMARSGFLARSTTNGRERAKSTLKSQERKPTKPEKILWTRMVEIVGCVACRIDGNVNSNATIHHIDGRTKPGCHRKVLPLCAGHHQDGAGEDKNLIAVHPYKFRFEVRYGAQLRLLTFVHQLLAGPSTDIA